ncbi:MAG: hypothetical protein K9N00_04775 [Candidatus Marinimicrobia bacterium]|nr:hypothetical protein [Candidatus Neomarinimicrobiota bacterium]
MHLAAMDRQHFGRGGSEQWRIQGTNSRSAWNPVSRGKHGVLKKRYWGRNFGAKGVLCKHDRPL